MVAEDAIITEETLVEDVMAEDAKVVLEVREEKADSEAKEAIPEEKVLPTELQDVRKALATHQDLEDQEETNKPLLIFL